mgnify:CR=1 FL=1
MHGSLTNQFEEKYALIVLTPNVSTSGFRSAGFRRCGYVTKLSHQKYSSKLNCQKGCDW